MVKLELSSASTVDLLIAGDSVSDHLHARMIPGRVWIRSSKAWRLPLNQETLRIVEAKFPAVLVAREVSEAVASAESKLDRVRALKDLPLGVDDASGMPIRVKPYAHQVRAFRIAMELLAG
jgi:hypothetical protein